MAAAYTDTELLRVRALQQCHPELRLYLNFAALLPYLSKYSLITKEQREELIELQIYTTTQKADKLLLWLPRSRSDFLERFIQSLRESSEGTNHEELADSLEEALQEAQNENVPPLTVENILKVVQPVEDIWDVFSYLVGVEKRDELRKHHSSDEDGGWRALVDCWLHNDPRPSWRKLIWAIDWENIKAADRIRSFAEPLRDPTLTVERVTGVMEKVEGTWWVGEWLDVPLSKMKEIKEKYSTERERSCAYGEYWVNTFWDASWEQLAGILYYREEETALEEVVGKYLQTSRDPTLTTSKIMEVMKGKEGKWYDLGRGLDIRRSKRDFIKRHHQTDIQRMQFFLDYWERTHPAPSWKMVAEALRGVDEYTLAEEVITKYVRATIPKISELADEVAAEL